MYEALIYLPIKSIKQYNGPKIKKNKNRQNSWKTFKLALNFRYLHKTSKRKLLTPNLS